MKGSGLFDTKSSSFDTQHDTLFSCRQACNPGVSTISRLENMICSRARVNARNMSRETLYTQRSVCYSCLECENIYGRCKSTDHCHSYIYTLPKYRVHVAFLLDFKFRVQSLSLAPNRGIGHIIVVFRRTWDKTAYQLS